MREIYRSDVGLSQAGSGNGCRRFQYPSAAMSFPPVIPWPVALRQSRLRFTDWTILAPHPQKQNPAVYTKELTHPCTSKFARPSGSSVLDTVGAPVENISSFHVVESTHGIVARF